ncbi:POZ domain-containing protein [Thozetella sp. PMI_491]|nr:POZ domain-containing protein [Thozetella sp. PMI_491]
MASAPRSPSSTGADYRDEDCGVVDELRTTAIFSSISKLFLSDKFTDMTIRCPGREFKAHRAVVCTQSTFFDKALTGGFEESLSGVVQLPQADPTVLEKFLQFLYTGNYNDGVLPSTMPSAAAMMTPQELQVALAVKPGEIVVEEAEQDETEYDSELDDEEGENDPEEEYNEFCGDSGKAGELNSNDEPEQRDARAMFLSLRVYLMADQFDVPALRLLARDRFYREAEALYHNCNAFPDVVDELYDNTRQNDIAMREGIARLVANRLEDDEFKQKLEPVMRKHGDFGVDVLNCRMAINKTW